jgi:hypothetical protein
MTYVYFFAIVNLMLNRPIIAYSGLTANTIL